MGAPLGTVELRRRVLDHSSLFVGSTPLPLPLANAALEAIKILKTDKSLRPRLSRNTDYVKAALRAAAGPPAPGPLGAPASLPASCGTRSLAGRDAGAPRQRRSIDPMHGRAARETTHEPAS